MIYLHYYERETEFNPDYYGEHYLEPWASLIVENDRVNYNKSERDKLSETPLTFDINRDGNIIWKASSTAATKIIEYKKNDGEWVSISSTTGGTSIPVVSGDTILFRGDNTSYASSDSVYNTFSGSTAGFVAKGNIMSMIESEGFATLKTFTKDNVFKNMLRDCTGFTDASKLVLPATVLTNYCYQSLFKGDTALVRVPELPAMNLKNSCYQSMFQNCSALAIPPELPATTLANSCYKEMFSQCENLSKSPVLPATTLADSCYASMFAYCGSLTKLPELPATSLRQGCYEKMFGFCDGLTTIPLNYLPATTLAKNCYYNMFQGCGNLATPPELPVMEMAEGCYKGMFNGCTSLTTAPELPATTLANSCYQNMFNGCTSLTTAPELPATTLAQSCYETMFRGCTCLVTAPELPATTLAQNCYNHMFNACRSLNYIKCLATDISATGCTTTWVGHVSSSGTFVKNPSMSSWTTGNDGIPSTWTVVNDS